MSLSCPVCGSAVVEGPSEHPEWERKCSVCDWGRRREETEQDRPTRARRQTWWALKGVIFVFLVLFGGAIGLLVSLTFSTPWLSLVGLGVGAWVGVLVLSGRGESVDAARSLLTLVLWLLVLGLLAAVVYVVNTVHELVR